MQRLDAVASVARSRERRVLAAADISNRPRRRNAIIVV
jgi:hypothetical protein